MEDHTQVAISACLTDIVASHRSLLKSTVGSFASVLAFLDDDTENTHSLMEYHRHLQSACIRLLH